MWTFEETLEEEIETPTKKKAMCIYIYINLYIYIMYIWLCCITYSIKYKFQFFDGVWIPRGCWMDTQEFSFEGKGLRSVIEKYVLKSSQPPLVVVVSPPYQQKDLNCSFNHADSNNRKNPTVPKFSNSPAAKVQWCFFHCRGHPPIFGAKRREDQLAGIPPRFRDFQPC